MRSDSASPGTAQAGATHQAARQPIEQRNVIRSGPAMKLVQSGDQARECPRPDTVAARFGGPATDVTCAKGQQGYDFICMQSVAIDWIVFYEVKPARLSTRTCLFQFTNISSGGPRVQGVENRGNARQSSVSRAHSHGAECRYCIQRNDCLAVRSHSHRANRRWSALLERGAERPSRSTQSWSTKRAGRLSIPARTASRWLGLPTRRCCSTDSASSNAAESASPIWFRRRLAARTASGLRPAMARALASASASGSAHTRVPRPMRQASSAGTTRARNALAGTRTRLASGIPRRHHPAGAPNERR